MNRTEITLTIAQLFTEAEKLSDDVYGHHRDWSEWQLAEEDNSPPPDWLIDQDDALVRPYEQLLDSLFLATVCLLDELKLSSYLKQFYLRFGEQFDKVNAAANFEVNHYVDYQPFNVFLNNLRQFLSPLGFLKDEARYLRLSGVQYLETILRNTATIIQKSGTSPTSEPDVYKAVRAVLEAIFPTARSPRSNFMKAAQEYKPDILIPEIAAVVEYKYAADEAKLKATIGQIADDVKGYTGDPEYHLYYAVFYVTQDFWGSAKFDAVWSEKGFPANWRAFYVVGE